MNIKSIAGQTGYKTPAVKKDAGKPGSVGFKTNDGFKKQEVSEQPIKKMVVTPKKAWGSKSGIMSYVATGLIFATTAGLGAAAGFLGGPLAGVLGATVGATAGGSIGLASGKSKAKGAIGAGIGATVGAVAAASVAGLAAGVAGGVAGAVVGAVVIGSVIAGALSSIRVF